MLLHEVMLRNQNQLTKLCKQCLLGLGLPTEPATMENVCLLL